MLLPTTGHLKKATFNINLFKAEQTNLIYILLTARFLPDALQLREDLILLSLHLLAPLVDQDIPDELKHSANVVCVLRTREEELQVQQIRDLLDPVSLDLYHVQLVPNEHNRHIHTRKLPDIGNPPVEGLEALLLLQVEDEDDGVRTPVVRLGQRPKPLLAGSVPYLETDGLALGDDLLCHKVYANCTNHALVKCVLGEFVYYGSLADVCVADNDDFVTGMCHGCH